MIKIFQDNIFNILNKFESEGEDFVIDLNFNGEFLVKKLNQVLDLLDDVTLASLGIQNCFIDPEFKLNTDFKDTIDDIDFDHVTINKVDKKEEEREPIVFNPLLSPNFEYEDKVIITKHDLTNKVDSFKNPDNDKIIDKIIKPVENPKKLIYNNGSIFIEDKDKNRVKIIYNNDSNNKDTGIKKQTLTNEEINKITNNNINNFDTMIEIRDFINNVTNSEVVKIINQMSKVDKEISEEIKKKNPNYQIIQDLQDQYENLTNQLESAKKENNMFISNDSISKQPLYSDYNSDIIISSDYEVDLQEKKELLEEVEEIVIKNNAPLTNFEIIQLLK